MSKPDLFFTLQDFATKKSIFMNIQLQVNELSAG